MRKTYPAMLILAILANLISYTPAASQTPEVTPAPTREVDVHDTWDLPAIYPNSEAWEADFQTVEETYLPQYANYQGKLGDEKSLLAYLQMNDQAGRITDKLYVYAGMTSDENQTDSAAFERFARAESLDTRLTQAGSFVTPELLALPEQALRAYRDNPQLRTYRHMLDVVLRQKAHTLSKEAESLLAASGEMANGPETIYTKITEADMQFPVIKGSVGEDIQLSEDVYYQLLLDPDRELRKRAFEGVLGSYNASRYSLAAALDSQMRKDIFYAQSRKYASSLEASLDAGNIPVGVYTSLVQAANDNLQVLHEYIAMRKQVLQLDKVHTYDTYVPLVKPVDVSIPYKDAKIALVEALAPLGEDYIKQLRAGFDNRWIDVYPKENKLSGAYSWGSYDTHPYILMNYDDTMDGMLTLAHEMGHALNADYTNNTQAYVNSENPTFLAEVASTTNEMLTLRHMLDRAKDDDEKLYYLNQMAETIRGTFFTQVMYAEFEQQIHERVEKGDALSVDSVNEMWSNLLVKYLGPDYELDELARVGWARIPHFYYNFYVYQYATGIAAANQFVKDILENGQGAADAYLNFLGAGSSDYSVDLLKQAGVDMTAGAPVDNLLADFGRIVSQMEEILRRQGKIK